jgi:hypothetical protein
MCLPMAMRLKLRCMLPRVSARWGDDGS